MHLTGKISIVDHQSKLYEQEVALRYRILRVPLGLTFSPEQLAAEDTDLHVVYIEEGEVLGCLVLTPIDSKHLKMRQVAVDGHQQGKGIGKALVAFSEEYAKAQGYEWLECHARSSAIPFYLKLKWETVGEEFEEVTIPHFAMRKKL